MQTRNLAYGIIVLIVVAVFFSGCLGGPAPPVNPGDNVTPGNNFTPGNNVTYAGNGSVAEGNNHFATDLYSQLKGGEGNIFFSPFSISSALAMTYEGARGQTADEMSAVLHLEKNDSARRGGYAALFAAINRGNKSYELKTANDLWIQKDKPLLENYTQVVQTYYGGSANLMDFHSDPEGSRMAINGRVENQTEGKIQNLIPSGLITTDTRLVLTNAVYFKGEWARQFNTTFTKEEDFTLGSGAKNKVPMMHRTDSFNYSEVDGIQVLEMPYSGGDLSMLVLLPKSGELGQLENSLTPEKLEAWKAGMRTHEVEVYLPKFKFEAKYMLGDTLQNMGMRQAFSDSADFSGMTQAEGLKIDRVVHKAFVEVDEKGTAAAAATAVIMVPTMAPGGEEPPTPVFRADHPFIFIIQEKGTGNILFMGRVADPTAG